MAVEHRLAFELYRIEGLESSAIDSIIQKISISKRSHEYIRRIILQGYLLDQIINKAGLSIPDIESSRSKNYAEYDSCEFKLRLNIDSNTMLMTPEDEIWSIISNISKRRERKNYLRNLFLQGFWIETLPSRDTNFIKCIFSNTTGNEVDVSTPPKIPKQNSTKFKLKGLIPS